MIENFEGCHVSYDPVAEHMEKLCNMNGWLFVCSKDQVFYHNLLPLRFSFLIWFKHDEEAQSLDQLLGWLHWKSEFT